MLWRLPGCAQGISIMNSRQIRVAPKRIIARWRAANRLRYRPGLIYTRAGLRPAPTGPSSSIPGE
jgi:hypothetical protein